MAQKKVGDHCEKHVLADPDLCLRGLVLIQIRTVGLKLLFRNTKRSGVEASVYGESSYEHASASQ